MGQLTLIIGCMFAQKTTELLRQIRRYSSIGYRVRVVNYKEDTRYGENCISSHDVDQHPAQCVERLSELEGQLGDVDVLVIDEGQFFGDLYECVTRWCDTLPLHVIVCGLDGDAARRPFGDVLRLVPHAENLMRLSAYCAECRDGTHAHFTLRTVMSEADPLRASEEQKAVGGADMYKPVCRRHYLAGDN